MLKLTFAKPDLWFWYYFFFTFLNFPMTFYLTNTYNNIKSIFMITGDTSLILSVIWPTYLAEVYGISPKTVSIDCNNSTILICLMHKMKLQESQLIPDHSSFCTGVNTHSLLIIARIQHLWYIHYYHFSYQMHDQNINIFYVFPNIWQLKCKDPWRDQRFKQRNITWSSHGRLKYLCCCVHISKWT